MLPRMGNTFFRPFIQDTAMSTEICIIHTISCPYSWHHISTTQDSNRASALAVLPDSKTCSVEEADIAALFGR